MENVTHEEMEQLKRYKKVDTEYEIPNSTSMKILTVAVGVAVLVAFAIAVSTFLNM